MKATILTALALFLCILTARALPSRQAPIPVPTGCELHAIKHRKRGRK